MAIGPIIRGEGFSWGHEFIDDRDAPFDLPGYVVVVLIRNADKTVRLTKRSDAAGSNVVITAAATAVDVYLTGAETAEIDPKSSIVVKLGYPGSAAPDGFEWDQTLFDDALDVVTI